MHRLWHGAVPVHAHDQGIGISDHHWVSYDVDSAPPPPVISWPKPANIQPIKVCDLPDRWASAWADTQPSFLAALLDEDVELAWSLLSHAAEMALGDEGGGGQARGQCTIPTTCPVVSRESKEVQSIRCRRLERTLRRWQDGLAKQWPAPPMSLKNLAPDLCAVFRSWLTATGASPTPPPCSGGSVNNRPMMTATSAVMDGRLAWRMTRVL